MNWDESSQVKEKNEKKVEVDKKPWQTETEIHPEMEKTASSSSTFFSRKHFI